MSAQPHKHEPTAEINGTIMQYFHWYCAEDGSLWNQVKQEASALAAAGITALWLPPAYKGTSAKDVGYSTYDLFDLGEFDQKGTVRTKYGTRAELEAAIAAARSVGLQMYLDVVFNHKNGADEVEPVTAVPVAQENRNWVLGPAREIRVWSRFLFPGRGDRYSRMKWDARCFDAVNHNASDPHDHNIYRLVNKTFDTEVSYRHGNYDFLMACDLDTDSPEVCAELEHWGRWIVDTLAIDGFRLDAIKHIRASFFKDWLDRTRTHARKPLFAVGEYWDNDIEALHHYITQTQGKLSLFDVPLHYNFHTASRAGRDYDLRQLLDGTLMQQQPALAVTFVENHDSQPLQALESTVEPWFKPIAYATILLRREGYPCVFYADYYGAHYHDYGPDGNLHEVWLVDHRWILDRLLDARQNFAYGGQIDYFDHPNTVGWTRLGTPAHPKAMAVLISNGDAGTKWMDTRKPHTTFRDLTEHDHYDIATNEFGWAEFRCPAGSVSVWVEN